MKRKGSEGVMYIQKNGLGGKEKEVRIHFTPQKNGWLGRVDKRSLFKKEPAPRKVFNKALFEKVAGEGASPQKNSWFGRDDKGGCGSLMRKALLSPFSLKEKVFHPQKETVGPEGMIREGVAPLW